MGLQRVKEYVQAGSMPPDPCKGDLCVHRVAGESVYSVLPMTTHGRQFVIDYVLEHRDIGTVHGDLFMCPQRNIVELCDAMFDLGLVVG